MFRFPDLPRIDLTSFDVSRLAAFDVPGVDLRTVRLPSFAIDGLDTKVVAAAKHATYLSVGLGVTALERAGRAGRGAAAAAAGALGALGTAVSNAADRAGGLAA